MKAGWQMKTLGDVCDKASSNVSQNQLNDEVGNYPIYGASGLIKNVSFYHRDKPYLSIVKDGSGVGRVTKMKAFTSVIGTLQYILPNEEVDLDYLNYSLMSVDFKKYVAGAAIPHIYFKDYKNEPFLWMPIPEQQRIVAILDHAFEGIAKARANAEQNLQNARALFESYLQSVFSVRGEPVEPHHPSTSSGRTGEGWVEKDLGSISKINYGFTASASYEKAGPHFLRITDIQDTGVNWETVPYCKISTDDLPKYLLQTGDIVFARTGATTGKSYLVKNPPQAVFASYLIRVQLKLSELLPEFLFLFFQTKAYWDEVNKGLSGSAQGGFNASKLASLIIPYPLSIEEQKVIIAELEAIKKETQRLEALYQRKIACLDELKKSLLQQAFAGEM